MGNQSSKPSSERDVSHNEPNLPPSTPPASGSVGPSAAPAAASQGKQPRGLSHFKTSDRANSFGDVAERQALAATSQLHRSVVYGETPERAQKITKKLLHAIAYGMESREVNIDARPNDLLAQDLLRRSPEFLLEKGDVTDWGGRTFTHITAFQYALWAKDFKMLEMMLNCIPVGEKGVAIRTELLRQYEQVTMPRYQGGGLTYMHTYERPKVDATGIPIKNASGNWDCETVTEERWGNHFDITPLLTAYENYDTHFSARTRPQRNAYWIKVIGTLQHSLPIHILQRYCDPDTPFAPLPSFTGAFKRTTEFFNYLHGILEPLLYSSLSTDFSLFRGRAWRAVTYSPAEDPADARVDLAAVRQAVEVSTSEIETKIKQLLTGPAQSQMQFRS